MKPEKYITVINQIATKQQGGGDGLILLRMNPNGTITLRDHTTDSDVRLIGNESLPTLLKFMERGVDIVDAVVAIDDQAQWKAEVLK